jgi:hypothetical protein
MSFCCDGSHMKVVICLVGSSLQDRCFLCAPFSYACAFPFCNNVNYIHFDAKVGISIYISI